VISDCIVVGAGISGLLAAERLARAGVKVTVLDKARGVGGRMATRRIGERRFDHGVQFFTAESDEFSAMAESWCREEIAGKWDQPFRPAVAATAPPYYYGTDGMTGIGKHLARDLDVRLQTRASDVTFYNRRWHVRTESGNEYDASSLVVTAPAPQTLALFEWERPLLPRVLMTQLTAITYEPCIALLVAADDPGPLEAPGGRMLGSDTAVWVADGRVKGISGDYGVVIQASPRFSRLSWHGTVEEIAARLVRAVEDELDAKWLVLREGQYQVHRWRYSRVTKGGMDSCVLIDQPGPLIFAGDGFGPHDGVERAALSGLRAADTLLAL
jgi:predicted NAD/FAD-dependent oxidoreductase